MSSLRKAFIKDESGNPVWAKAHLSSVYDDNGTPLSTTLSNIESTTYVPTLSLEPSSSTTTYTKDGVTHNFEIGQFARVSNSGSYDFYQLTNLVLENNTPVATWQKVVKSNNAGCVTIPSAPTSTTTSYTKDGETIDFKVGDEVRVADPENAPEGANGYVYYKLYDLTEDQGTKTAYWDLIGKDSSKGKVVVSIAALDGEQVISSSQLGNITVTCTQLDNNVSQSITWSGSDITFTNLIPIKDYRISVEEKKGDWIVDKEYIDINLSIGEERNISFLYSEIHYAYVRFRQSISDETSMIVVSETLNGEKQTLDPSTGKHENRALQLLRNSSHLYMGKYGNGTMVLRQLKDNDGIVYADDNSVANMTGVDGNHFLRIDIQFFIKRVDGTDSGDDVTYCLAVGGQPEGTGWKQIITPNDLLGVHEATASDTGNNTNGILKSISGGTSTGSISQANFKQKARNGGNGFTLVTWEWHCMMAFLFYAWYGRTNAQAQCGTGADSYTRTLGTKDSLGMTDTDSTNGNTDNTKFWGIENWWGDKDEWVDNVVVNARVWKVTDKSGTQRTAGTGASTSDCIQKMLLSENLDMIPTAVVYDSNYTTYYCDKYTQSADSSSVVVMRSDSNANASGGVAYVYASFDSSKTNASVGTRLAFNGTIADASVTKLRFKTSNDVAVVGETVTVATPCGTESYVTDANGEFCVLTVPGSCTISCLTHTFNTYQFTAIVGYNVVNITATENPLEKGYIILDQTSSDPTTKVIDENGHTYSNYTRPSVINSIKAASHCYVGTYSSDSGKMSLKQLSDTDGRYYADGSSATTDLTTTGKDTFMRLPFFFTRVSEYATDKVKIEFAYDQYQTATETAYPAGSGWKKWGGNDLIGKYEASVASSMVYSVSGQESKGNVTQSGVKSYARTRGTGFTLVKWRHHCIMAILFYAYYGHTNSQEICGYGYEGASGDNRITGLKNSLGMTDTTSSNGNTNNIVFWGLENWWGCKYEYIDNVTLGSNSLNITEDDGTIRYIYKSDVITNSAYPTKFILGDNLDIIGAAGQTGGTNTTGYCDTQSISTTSGYVLQRSCYYGSGCPNGGISYFSCTANNGTSGGVGTRLAYTGPIEIV